MGVIFFDPQRSKENMVIRVCHPTSWDHGNKYIDNLLFTSPYIVDTLRPKKLYET